MTAGFENHTPELVIVGLEGFNGENVGELKVQHSIMNKGKLVINMQVWSDILDEKVLTTAFACMNRREAIFLRNRLTAFIEEGLDAE